MVLCIHCCVMNYYIDCDINRMAATHLGSIATLVSSSTTSSSTATASIHSSNAATVAIQLASEDDSITLLPFGSCLVDVFGGAAGSIPPIPVEIKLGYDSSDMNASLISCTIRRRSVSSADVPTNSNDNNSNDSKTKAEDKQSNDTSSSNVACHDWYPTLLEHSAICPTRYLHQRSSTSTATGATVAGGTGSYIPRIGAAIRFAVCILVECPIRGFLITRRAAHMRAFPAAWVFPGMLSFYLSCSHLDGR
jgi:hypothetical protein